MFRTSDRDGQVPAARVEVDLAALRAALEQAATALAAAGDDAPREPVLAVIAERLAEGGLSPPAPELEADARALDPVAWRWFALTAAVLDHAPVRSALPSLLRGRYTADVVSTALLDVARQVAARAPSDQPGWLAAVRRWLTAAVQPAPAGGAARAAGDGRAALEVLARMVLAQLGAAIAGEDDARARAVLAEVDYQRLLAELPRARDELRGALARAGRRNIDSDVRLPPRGKW